MRTRGLLHLVACCRNVVACGICGGCALEEIHCAGNVAGFRRGTGELRVVFGEPIQFRLRDGVAGIEA